MIETRLSSDSVDILLMAEATYPFERGGVASWIYEMIKNMPQYRFGILFLGGYQGMYNKPMYLLPENLVHLQIVYLFSNTDDMTTNRHEFKCDPHTMEAIKTVHTIFRESHTCPIGLTEPLSDIHKLFDPKTGGMSHQQFLHSEVSWEYITEQYELHSTSPSFINYFWNVLNLHAALWRLAAVVDTVPKARIIHTASTGYAGLMGTMLHQCYKLPLILSEHGIYTKERSIDLLQSSMLPRIDPLLSNKKSFSYEHRLWLAFFDSLARICYQYADPILSLYQGAQAQQIANGANPLKTQVVPNGVNLSFFAPLRRPPGTDIPKIVCFIGRFVRMKDIKTFIRAFSIMIQQEGELVTTWIKAVGNTDNEYLQECMDYVDLLGLKSHIHFVTQEGMVNILPHVGLLILSSISEGMPLVLLESLAAGVPAVVTDVGSCREIIEGRDEADKALGTCGAVVSVGDSAGIARESLKLLYDPQRWYQAQHIAIERVEKYYNQTEMITTYESIYETAIHSGEH